MRRWWACAWLLSLASCVQEAPPLPEPTALGLAEAPTEHVIAGAAIRKAATILGPDAKIKLYPGWRGRKRGVAIYTLTSDSLAASEVIGTYDECGCILLSNARLEAWLVGEMGTGIGRLDIDRTSLLTYMLLHEAGHVAQGNTPCGLALSGGAASATVDARLNMTDTAQKVCERAADRYASEAVRAALEQKGSDRGIAAAQVAIALSELAFNLQAKRMLDRFGENVMRSPSLFRDLGLSHPNLEWRILSANAMITPSPTSEELLQAFETARTEGPILLKLSPPS
ncbi:hypothetical protein NRB_13850 [Novosphingobium sp. 11B]